MTAFAFYLFSTVLVGSAWRVIRASNPVHSVLFLILCFFNAAGLFVLLGAELISMLLVIVYVGAVAVLFLFVVMMLDIKPRRKSFFYTSQNLKLLGQAFLRFFSYGSAWILIFILTTCVLSYGVALSVMIKPSILYYGMPILFVRLYKDFFIPQHTFEIALGVTVISALLSVALTNRLTKTSFIQTARAFFRLVPMSLGITLLLLMELSVVVRYWVSSPYARQAITSPMPPAELMSNTEALGLLIYKDYVYAFQTAGLVLLVAMIGAIVLTLRRRKPSLRPHTQEQLKRRRDEVLEKKKIPLREGI